MSLIPFGRSCTLVLLLAVFSIASPAAHAVDTLDALKGREILVDFNERLFSSLGENGKALPLEFSQAWIDRILAPMGLVKDVSNFISTFNNDMQSGITNPLQTAADTVQNILPETRLLRSAPKVAAAPQYAVDGNTAIRDVVSNCTVQLSNKFGWDMLDASLFNDVSFNTPWADADKTFGIAASQLLDKFCQAFIYTVDAWNAAKNSSAVLNLFGLSAPVRGVRLLPSPAEIAESLLAAHTQKTDGDSASTARTLPEIENFITEAQSVVQQLGRNVGSMFGTGVFDAVMADSFLNGFLGTLGSNTELAGIFTDALNELMAGNNMMNGVDGGILSQFAPNLGGVAPIL